MPLYDGPRRFDETFLAQMRAEERPFLGDTTALWRLSLLAQGDHPLLTIRDEASPSPSPAGACWRQARCGRAPRHQPLIPDPEIDWR